MGRARLSPHRSSFPAVRNLIRESPGQCSPAGRPLRNRTGRHRNTTRGPDKPLHETYCAIVGRTGQTFYTEDAQTDARIADHPARQSVISYCGALLAGPDGPFGSLCNFDLIPRPTTPSEILVLEAAAPVVMATIIETRAGEWS